MNNILIAGTLFPAVPLAINNGNGRYTAVAIILMAVSMSLFVVKIYLSTGALKIHIGGIETLSEKTVN